MHVCHDLDMISTLLVCSKFVMFLASLSYGGHVFHILSMIATVWACLPFLVHDYYSIGIFDLFRAWFTHCNVGMVTTLWERFLYSGYVSHTLASFF